MTYNGCYVSDLHMFSRRSQEDRYRRAIPQAVIESDLFVLGGDILDFRWSTLSSSAETVDHGIAWLTSLLERNPDCEIHYVLGNHDFNQTLMTRLDELATECPTFAWHRYYFRKDDKLFLHGDVADREMDHAELVARRAKSDERDERRFTPHYLYDLAIQARLHKLPSVLLHSPPQVTRRILRYVSSTEFGEDQDLRHIYFGHTHRAMSNYRCGNLLFHNGGAPIKGIPFEILRF